MVLVRGEVEERPRSSSATSVFTFCFHEIGSTKRFSTIPSAICSATLRSSARSIEPSDVLEHAARPRLEARVDVAFGPLP
jgi:hypothetical protein